MADNQAVNDYRYSETEIKDSIARWIGPGRIPKQIRVFTDTSDFFRVGYDDVAILGGRPYLIRNNEREGRFGIDEQQKFWVKKAVDLADGTTKIIKLTFYERFETKVGEFRFKCFRSPRKEARILELVKTSDHFMQGFSVKDAGGNLVRILDFIKGKTLGDYVLTLGQDHHDYYHNYFPGVLDEYIELVEAIQFLHGHEEKHGDIRRDHIIKEKETGKCRWIDFDFNYLHKESICSYDLFGLGNILVYLAGRGDVTVQNLKKDNSPVYENLTREDLNIIFNNRVVNLKKVYPYVPDSLNMVMLHFSLGANIFYDDTGQLLNDLYEVRRQLS